MTTADYSREDIVHALEEVEIEEGDAIFVHSNLGFFGELDGASTREEYTKAFYEAVWSVIGESGTLVVPTFTYSFTEGNSFDPEETPSDMGMFSEYVRELDESQRSIDPNFSIAAVGDLAEDLTADAPNHSFGRDSFWERFLANDGKYCNFNFDAASTSIHYAERCLDVEYRWDKPFAGEISRGDETERRVFYHYVRDLSDDGHEPDFSAFDRKARREGFVSTADLGKGQIVSIGASQTYDVVESGYLEDRSFLIQGEEV